MQTGTVHAKGWPNGHPFVFLLFLAACTAAPPPSGPPSVAPPAACGTAAPAGERRVAFTMAESGLPRTGQWRNRFDLADVNGDGEVDLVHGPARKGPGVPSIFLGDGTGRFIPWRTAHFPPLPYEYGDAKAADFDGNGRMDLALASHLRGLTVLLQESDGSFAPWGSGLDLRLPSGTAPPPFGSRAIAVTDWNGDGLPDLLALNEGPSQLGPPPPPEAMALFLNRGGEWQRAATGAPKGFFGTSIATGDVDGDGKRDAMLGTSVGGVRSLLQLGDGKGWTTRDLQSLTDRASVTAVAVHRLAGERRDAIVAASAWSEGDASCVGLDVIRLMDDGDESTAVARESSSDPFVAIVPADFDGDRLTDLLAVRMKGSMTLYRGVQGGFARDADVAAPEAMAGCDAYDAHVADLDRDESPEVVVSFAGELAASLGPQCTRGGGFVVWRVGRAR